MNCLTFIALWVAWMSCGKIGYAVNCLTYSIPLSHEQFCELAVITEV